MPLPRRTEDGRDAIEIFGARANDAREQYQMDFARAFGELT